MTENQCQICSQLDEEDLCILNELFIIILKYLKDQKVPSQYFPNIFKHLKFKKCLAQVFDAKYLEISDKCPHSKCLTSLESQWTTNETADVTGIDENIDKGLDDLYEEIQSKQKKLKQSKEQFDRLANLLFNCDGVESDHGTQSETSNSEDQNEQNNQNEQNEQNENNENNEQLDLNEPNQEILDNNSMKPTFTKNIDFQNPNDQPMMQFNKNSNKNKFQKRSIDILKKWFLDHLDNPYPENNEKSRLSQVTGMHVRQIQNWFTNARKRYLEPLKKKFEHTYRAYDSESEEKPQKKQIKETEQGNSNLGQEQQQKQLKCENDQNIQQNIKKQSNFIPQFNQMEQMQNVNQLQFTQDSFQKEQQSFQQQQQQNALYYYQQQEISKQQQMQQMMQLQMAQFQQMQYLNQMQNMNYNSQYIFPNQINAINPLMFQGGLIPNMNPNLSQIPQAPFMQNPFLNQYIPTNQYNSKESDQQGSNLNQSKKFK